MNFSKKIFGGLVALAGLVAADFIVPEENPSELRTYQNPVGKTASYRELFVYSEAYLLDRGLTIGQSVSGIQLMLTGTTADIECTNAYTVIIGEAAFAPESITNGAFEDNHGDNKVICFQGPLSISNPGANTFFDFVTCDNAFEYQGGPLFFEYGRGSCSFGNSFVYYENVAATDASKIYYSGFEIEGPDSNILYTRFLTTGGASGDPHLVGFDGSRFNFDGIPGEVFSLVSTPTFQLNMRLDAFDVNGVNGTWITDIGIVTAKKSVAVSAIHGSILIDQNEVLTAAQPDVYHFDGVSIRVKSNGIKMKQATITFEDVRATLEFQYSGQRAYLDIQVALLKRPENIHGVLGQTAWSLLGESAKENKEFTLVGSLQDYLVKDGLLGSDFSFNQYSQNAVHRTQARSLTSIEWIATCASTAVVKF